MSTFINSLKERNMTKSISINYQEADAPLLFGILKNNKFRQLTPKTVVFEPKDDEPVSDAEFIAEFKASIEEVRAHKRGEIILPTFEESMVQMRKELAEEGYDVL